MKKKIIIITLLMMLICANVYGATSNNEYQWSTETKSLTINDFNNIVELCTGISEEDFSKYTFTNNSNNYGSSYDEMIYRLNNNSYFKGFATYNNLFALVVQTNNYTYLTYNTSDSGYYTISSVVYTFDFENKIIKYYQAIPITLNDKGNTKWRYKNTTNLTLEEFKSNVYMKDMMYDSFYLIMGELYNNSSKNTLLNYKISYKVTEKEYSGQIFSGDIDFSNAFEKWITNNLSDNFKMAFYSYYLEKYDYGENYISPNYTSREKISDVTFLSNSNYLPTIEQVNKTIKSGEAWENYIYTISLSIDNGINDERLLVSDMFIVDEKPISMIEHFNYKYDYINYTNYINTEEEENPSSSGDTYYNYDFNEYFQKPWIAIDNVQGLVQSTSTIPFKIMSQSGDEYFPFDKLKLDLRVYKIYTDESGKKTQSLFDTYKRYNGDYVDTSGYNSVTQNGKINVYNYDLRSKFDSNFIDTYLNSNSGDIESGNVFDYAFQLVLYSFWEDELSSTKLFYFYENNNLNSGTIPDNYYDNNWNGGGNFNFENMNFDSVLNTAKNFLSSIFGFFSLFPDWLIYLLTFGISVGIILRILGR